MIFDIAHSADMTYRSLPLSLSRTALQEQGKDALEVTSAEQATAGASPTPMQSGPEADDTELFAMQTAMQKREESSGVRTGLTATMLNKHARTGGSTPPAKKRMRGGLPVEGSQPQAEAAWKTSSHAASGSLRHEDSFGGTIALHDQAWQDFLDQGWSKCVMAHTLSFHSLADCKFLLAPKSKNVDAAKWKTAVQDLAPQMLVFHNLLVDNTKPNDQQLKSTATALKKAAVNKPKKAGLKAEAIPLMGDPIRSLSELLSDLKTCRSTVLGAKPAKLAPSEVKSMLEKLETSWGKIFGTTKETKNTSHVTHVALPEVWIHAWVGASVPTLISELSEQQAKNAVDSSIIAKLKNAIFLSPDSLKKDPTDDNAYGMISDFFYFTKNAFKEDVKMLQLRLLGQALSQLFSTKDNTECIYDQLLDFLPQPSMMGKAILCQESANAMATLYEIAQTMKHKRTHGTPPAGICLADLVEQSECLKAGNMKSSKALAKFQSSTSFKRLLRDLHSAHLI